uniref:uncharacterized protein isoform X1 n=1 Tax=Myxine glutinosa TaxID=7769 RepID=UPI00358FD726
MLNVYQALSLTLSSSWNKYFKFQLKEVTNNLHIDIAIVVILVLIIEIILHFRRQRHEAMNKNKCCCCNSTKRTGSPGRLDSEIPEVNRAVPMMEMPQHHTTQSRVNSQQNSAPQNETSLLLIPDVLSTENVTEEDNIASPVPMPQHHTTQSRVNSQQNSAPQNETSLLLIPDVLSRENLSGGDNIASPVPMRQDRFDPDNHLVSSFIPGNVSEDNIASPVEISIEAIENLGKGSEKISKPRFCIPVKKPVGPSTTSPGEGSTLHGPVKPTKVVITPSTTTKRAPKRRNPLREMKRKWHV